MKIQENNKVKQLHSEAVNYTFDKVTGFSYIWGKSVIDNPEYSPFGPFIADIEITTSCSGINNVPCAFCYKSNTHKGDNMSFDTFKQIFDKLPKILQQIAFGVDSRCESNPDTFKIFEYCRENGVIPNVTVADISQATADKLAKLCGAVSVSRYSSIDVCYNSIARLSLAGLKQTNMHVLLSEETFETAFSTLFDIKHDERLKKLNAIVFLSLKQKGRGKTFTPLSEYKFNQLVKMCLSSGIKFGFDSCSSIKFLNAINYSSIKSLYTLCTEQCESTRFSAYINVHGRFFPCSFSEMGEGLDVLNCNDFLIDIWNNQQTQSFRKKSIDCLNNKQACPIYEV